MGISGLMCYMNLCCHVSCVMSRVMCYVNSYLREFFFVLQVEQNKLSICL